MLIDPIQSAIIKGRCIADNIITIEELIFNIQKCNLTGHVFKVNLTKAFDMVDSNFLQDPLKAHGFGNCWIAWIRVILSTSKARILLMVHQRVTFDINEDSDIATPFPLCILCK